jgi:hypothetical protein
MSTFWASIGTQFRAAFYPDKKSGLKMFLAQQVAHNHKSETQLPCLSSSSSSALEPWMGLALLKQMSPATSTLGNRQPISTTQFPCVFLYPVNLS